MKHIVLRGARGVGKSSLLRRMISETGLLPGGFLTEKAPPDADGVSHTYIYPADRAERQPSEENCVGACRDGRLLFRRSAVFDTLGTRYLHGSDGKNVVLMDELGFLETDAPDFQRAVLQALDGDLPVLAAVKDKDIPFLEKVCNHPKVCVYRITEENRERLFWELLPILAEMTEE